MLAILVFSCLVHYSMQGCCAPEQWEGALFSTSSAVNLKAHNVTYSKGNYFLSVDAIHSKVASVGTSTINGVTYQVHQVQDYLAGVQYTDVDGVCTKIPLVGPFQSRCIPDNATLVSSTDIGAGSLSRNVDIYQYMQNKLTLNMQVEQQGCIPLGYSFYGDSETGEKLIGSVGFTGITAGIQDISAFATPRTCANVPLTKPNPNTNAFGKRSTFF